MRIAHCAPCLHYTTACHLLRFACHSLLHSTASHDIRSTLAHPSVCYPKRSLRLLGSVSMYAHHGERCRHLIFLRRIFFGRRAWSGAKSLVLHRRWGGRGLFYRSVKSKQLIRRRKSKSLKSARLPHVASLQLAPSTT